MVGHRDKKSTRHRCLPQAIHTDVITCDAVDDQVVRASSLCLRGGTSYVFAGSFWGRRPEAVAAENGEVPLPGTPFHTTTSVHTSTTFVSVAAAEVMGPQLMCELTFLPRNAKK